MSDTEPTPDQTSGTVPAPADNASTLARWAQDAREAYHVARWLAGTPFVSPTMRNNPALIMATILTGQEVGLAPMAALRSIDIAGDDAGGTPAMRAATMRGLVQAAGHEVWVDDGSNSQWAIVYGRRRGSDQVQRSRWDMDRAKKLGVTGSEHYRTQPGAMFIARATGEVCRLIASDVLFGLQYAAEELTDTTPAAGKPASKRKRTAQRRPLPPEPATPALAEPEALEPDPNSAAAEPAPEVSEDA